MRDIVAELKALRLHGMARCYEEQSAHGGASVEIAAEFFGGLLDAEVADRRVRSIHLLRRVAFFSGWMLVLLPITTFPFRIQNHHTYVRTCQSSLS